MTNSDHSRGDRQGQPANPHNPRHGQHPDWQQAQRGYEPQKPSGGQAHGQVPVQGSGHPYGYSPEMPQGYPAANPGHPHAGYGAGGGGEPDYSFGHEFAGGADDQRGAGDAAAHMQRQMPGFAPASDDYYYPQDQHILPDVPPAALPPELSGNAGLGGGVPYPPQYQPHGHHAPQATGPAHGGYVDYADVAPEQGTVEQISQRLAQLQSQYDREMANAGWQDAQHRHATRPQHPDVHHHQARQTHDDSLSDPQMYAAREQAQFYRHQQHLPQGENYSHDSASVQQHDHRHQEFQAESTGYHTGYGQPQSYGQESGYQAPEPAYAAQQSHGHAHTYGERQAPAYSAEYQQEGHAPFAAGTVVAQQVAEGGGKRKLMMAAAFVGALAVGGGVAVTQKFPGLIGSGQETSESGTPVVQAGAGPVKVLSGENSSDAGSQNRALHQHMSGAEGSGDRIGALVRENNGDSMSGANQGMLPPAREAADAADASGTRRVKTLVVRPDGTIVQPSEAPAMEIARPSSDDVLARASRAAAEGVTSDAGDGSPALKQMPAPVAAKESEDVGTASSQPAATSMVQRVAPEPKKMAAVSPSTASATGEVGIPYVVQVSSNNSPSDALVAFADMQQKYPSLIGTYEPDIERADLGNKGVWYRLRVGPIAGKTAAVDLCSRLKAAGHSGCLPRRK